MKLLLSTLLAGSTLLPGQTLLFQDNFDVADNTSFDASSTVGRLTGTLAENIVLRAHRAQQQIQSNQLRLAVPAAGGAGGVRFNPLPEPFTSRFNWAAGATGADILASGGFVVTFDWTPANNTATQWITWAVGTPNADTGGSIVNSLTTDYGILLRNNGGTQRFDNSIGLGNGGAFPTTAGGTTTYSVSLEYIFSDFADNSSVTAITTVDGTEVANDVFTWDGNTGELYMEMATNLTGNLINNLAISTRATAGYSFDLAKSTFASGAPQGTLIGDLGGSFGGNPEQSTFSLVSGAGDTDNDKFQINGTSLEVGTGDFTGINSMDGQQYSIRIKGTGTDTAERSFTLTLTKDDDFDNLNDLWELLWANNLSDLSAASGDEDFDQDGLTNLEEYHVSIGTFNGGNTAYPNIDPTKKDTDEDTLEDGEEIVPAGDRPQTDPTNGDTDLDGLSDLVETNSGVFTDANNPGTDPTKCDTDGDYARDSWEITRNTNPLVADTPPAPLGPVAIVPITDAASTGLDPAKTYTHLISGGQAATVNGVAFELLSPTTIPANFAWDTMGNTMNAITANLGDWTPAAAGIDTEIQTLLSSFIYSGNGAAPGSSQRFTLTNLTPGANYDFRLYVRIWDTDGAGRPDDLVFTNGTEMVQPFGALPLDRPGIVTGSGNNHDAYYLTYTYTAQTTELIIDANVPLCGPNPSGSLHMYALSNEISTGVPLGQILITNRLFLPDGRFAIGFQAKPLTTYNVTKSSNLVGDFAPLDVPLSVTTDVNGEGQVIIPSPEFSDLKEFYRIEE